MFLFTSVVPPSMVLARLRNMPLIANGNELRSSSHRNATPSHAAPSRSVASNWMRWLSTLWCSLPTELSGPGERPALTCARTRWFVQSRMRSSL